MKWRLLVALPLASAMVPLCALLVRGTSVRFVHVFVVAAVQLAACLGSAYAASAFGRHDHLARAWGLQGANYLLLFARGIGVATGLLAGSKAALTADGIVIFIANLSAVAATWMLARTGALAGVGLEMSALRRRLIFAAGAAIAFAAAGRGMLLYLNNLRNGDLSAIVSIVSRLGDIACFMLIVPLLSTALALRRGLLVWPWALLAASLLCWLAGDAVLTVGRLSGLTLAQALPYYDVFRVPACLLAMSAGVAQRWVIRDIGRARPAGRPAGA